MEHGTVSCYTQGKCRCAECRAAKKAQRALYYQTHKETELARALKWQQENTERYRAQQKQYKTANRERVSAQKKVWNETHTAEVAAYHLRYREENLELLHERTRRLYLAQRDDRLAYQKNYYEAFPEKVRAHRAVARALLSGTLTKPATCSNEAAEWAHVGRIESHHDDYSRQLVVTWLCQRCHKLLHIQLSKEEVAS